MKAPIVLFAFNRPGHVGQTLAALASANLADKSELIAFVDGPRRNTPTESQEAVCAVIEQYGSSFARLELHRRATNLGLAANILDGVSSVLQRYERVIVLEDDIVVDRVFLEYMNWALDELAPETTVGSIHGYCYPGDRVPGNYFYMKGGDCWGWATWRDRWPLLDRDGRRLLSRIIWSGRLMEFTLGGAAPYCRLLCQQILGLNNSWAIRWHASLFLADRLTLYPCDSLVTNIGFDGSGEHCPPSDKYATRLGSGEATLPTTLPPPATSNDGKELLTKAFTGMRPGPLRAARRILGTLLDAAWVLRAWVTPRAGNDSPPNARA